MNTRRLRPGTQCAAFAAWLAQAKKGERFICWRGDLLAATRTPDQNMTKADRLAWAEAKAAAKQAGMVLPKSPDPYKLVRNDARALLDLIRAAENKALIEVHHISIKEGPSRTKICEVQMLIQRNGLAGVRAREAERFDALR